MAINSFGNPYSAKEIVKSDTVDTDPCVLYIGRGGNLKVTAAVDGGVVTFTNVPDGFYIPLVVKRVWASTTSCSGIIGMW